MCIARGLKLARAEILVKSSICAFGDFAEDVSLRILHLFDRPGAVAHLFAYYGDLGVNDNSADWAGCLPSSLSSYPFS